MDVKQPQEMPTPTKTLSEVGGFCEFSPWLVYLLSDAPILISRVQNEISRVPVSLLEAHGKQGSN